MAQEPQRDFSTAGAIRANTLVGTITEPGPVRIDMTRFDNVVDGSAIDGRTGNFLFTVGSVASGKSTLQNFLVHRLHVDENIHFDRTSRDGKTAAKLCTQALRYASLAVFPSRLVRSKWMFSSTCSR